MAKVQSHAAERDRKFVRQRKEARELEREGLQICYDLTRSTAIRIMVLLHLLAHKRRQQQQSRVAPMADTNNDLAGH